MDRRTGAFKQLNGRELSCSSRPLSIRSRQPASFYVGVGDLLVRLDHFSEKPVHVLLEPLSCSQGLTCAGVISQPTQVDRLILLGSGSDGGGSHGSKLRSCQENFVLSSANLHPHGVSGYQSDISSSGLCSQIYQPCSSSGNIDVYIISTRPGTLCC